MNHRLSLSALLVVLGVLVVAGGAGAQIPCGASTECVLNPTCQANGTCAGTNLPDTTTCDDDNPCTINDHCSSGVCLGTPAPSSTTCNDFNACTKDDHCSAGVCQGTTDVAKLNQACDLGFSHPCILGATCSLPPGAPFAFCLPNVKQCPDLDGNKCTVDQCDFTSQNGACIAPAKICGDDCNTATCRQSDGVCINPTPKANGTTCNDANLCTSPDTCQAGVCVGAVGPTATATKTATAGGATATRTPTSTSTIAATVTRTATRTATAGGATPSATPGSSACFGDCDASGMITASDLNRIRSTINLCGPCPGGIPGGVAAGCAAAPNGCVAADYDGDGCLRASELTRVVDNVLSDPSGCPSMPSGASVAKRSAGVLQSTTSAFLVLPRVVGALLGPVTSLPGGGGATTLFDQAFNCATSGGGSVRCDQDFMATPPFVTPPVYTVTLNSCKATTSAGRTVTLSGVVTATGTGIDVCGTLPTPLELSTQNLTIDEVGSAGSLQASFTNFTATVNLSGSDPICAYSGIDMLLTGDLSVVTKNAGGMTLTSTQAQFGIGSSISLLVLQYGAECLPVQYVMTVDGEVGVVTNGHMLSANYDVYTLTNDATAGDNVLYVDGSFTSECLGLPVSFLTDNPMVLAAGSPCPSEGDVSVESEPPGDLFFDSIHYGPGSVGIDEGDDGDIDASFNSCLDAALYVCPSP